MDLKNQGLFIGTLGTYDNVDVATTIVTTKLVDGLTATKSADKEIWVNGELTYTIKINNYSGEDYANVVLTDILDSALVTLVTNSVYVNGVMSPYSFLADILTVNLALVADQTETTIVFKVVRV